MVRLQISVNPFIMNVMKRDQTQTAAPKIGRPRAFEHDEALRQAMLVFWQHGYETTPLSLLTKKMKMNAPSIYSAFGDKKKLFLQALDLYVGKISDIEEFVDRAPSAFEAAEQMLRQSADRFTGETTPQGCMLASAVATGSPEAADVQSAASQIRAKIEGFLRNRIEVDVSKKILPKSTSPSDLAALTIAIIQGLSVLARDGASRKKLYRVIDISLQAWPSKKS